MSAQAPNAGPAIERKTGLPPGPRLPVAIQTYLYWGYADHYLRACHRRYGNAFTVRAFPAGTRVFLADPKDIKTVFTGDPEVFRAGEANAVLKPVMGSRSVLLIDGEEHIAQRRRMLPAFHGDSVSNYRDVVEAATHAEIDRWAPGRPFQLMDAMRRVTLEVILRAVIGAKDPQRLSALRETLPRVADVGGTVMLLWIRPEPLPGSCLCHVRDEDSSANDSVPYAAATSRRTLGGDEGAPHNPRAESWRKGPPVKPNTLSGTPRQRYRPRRRKPSTRNSNQKDRSQRWVRDQQPLTVTHRPSHWPIPGCGRQPHRTSDA
jgi:hypothetical protein